MLDSSSSTEIAQYKPERHKLFIQSTDRAQTDRGNILIHVRVRNILCYHSPCQVTYTTVLLIWYR